MGAVFPGAGDAPTFWRNIRAGTDAITEVPPERWDPAVYCGPAAGDGRFYTRRGGFLGDIAEFDPVPFGIMPAAVDGTEPDQLLMLRAAAEALGDSPSLPDRERVGVIIGRGGYLTTGVSRLDTRVRTVHQLTAVLSDLMPDLGEERLAQIRTAFAERLGPDNADALGMVPNFAASRLANRFDLHGPAYTVDAACASSLIAVDHAVRELATGRCDAVLAGGVHTCHQPALWSVFTRLRALSPSGVIRPLSAAADGTLMSEGTGAVLLKRLADARAAGDRIYAVIRGVGVSSDGRATSMMNPLVQGQELAIRRAWDAAGLDPAAPGSLGLLEAHGTATVVGDKAELTALGRVFGTPGEGDGRRIGIGTVKSMIGHAMPAAGIAGLIKTAFAVHEGVLPPTLHVGEPNPALAATRFEPVTRERPWDDGAPRRAAVSAFGFGGINAHVILEADETPARTRRARATSQSGPARSDTAQTGTARSGTARSGTARSGTARSGEAVLRLIADSAEEMTKILARPDSELLARAGTAPDDGPGDGPCRLAIVAPDARRLTLARKVAARGTPWRGRSDLWFTPRPLLRGPEQVAFLFPGFEPDFTPRIDGLAAAFGLPEPELRGTAAAGGGDGVVEQALDVIAVSRLYAAALDELGIKPGALAGHSLGEWTAMVAAGIYPEIDEFMASLRPGMVEVPDVIYLALGTSAARAGELISGLDSVVLTHDNCPRQSVVCGPAQAIAAAGERAREAGILAQALPFRTGFHSPMFAPYAEPMRQSLGELEVRAPRVPIWSATTLAEFPRDPGATRDLVLRHLVEPVRFRELTRLLHDSGIRAFVQVGPGSLTGFADDTLGGRDFLTVATATPKRDGLGQLRRAAAALWTEGLSPSFDRLTAVSAATASLEARDVQKTVLTQETAVSRSRKMRLKLGDPLISLKGAVTPLPVGATGVGEVPGATAIPADTTANPMLAQSVITELNALLAETTDSANAVIAAMRNPAGPTAAPAPAKPAPVPAKPAPVPAGPAPMPAAVPAAATSAPAHSPAAPPDPERRPAPVRSELTLEREFSLRTMPDIAHHCIFPQPDNWPDDTDRFPVVPMTTLLEIMGDAALELVPGRVVIGLEQVRAQRWLAVAPATHATIRAVRAAAQGGTGGTGETERVRITIEGYATGYVLLADRYPAAPLPNTTPLRGQRPAPVSARELYADGLMFHGPKFAGVCDIATLADDGITGTVLSLPARGALLDSAGQLIGHWMQVSRSTDQTVLPTGIAAIRYYGPNPPHGDRLHSVTWIREVTDTEMRADAELRGADGQVWCQIAGWATRRFATDDAIWQVKNNPDRHVVSQQAPGGWSFVHERWPDTASRELMMRRYLNAAERADYERLNPLQQRRWLVGRVAAKDAVRQFLWAEGAGPIYPCELTIAGPMDGDDIAVHGGFRVPPVAITLSPPDMRGRPYAAAAVGDDRREPPPGQPALLLGSPSPGETLQQTPPPATPLPATLGSRAPRG